MKTVLEFYDIYPKILCTEKPAQITICALSRHVDFMPSVAYRVQIVPMHETLLNRRPEQYTAVEAVFHKGTLTFAFCFEREQQYSIRLQERLPEQQTTDWTDRCVLLVHALAPDYFVLRPYRGDMHAHTYYSDGVESPDIVAANYRKAGFDFLSITDHEQYAPSLEAIEVYKSLDLDFRLFAGEEVHPPGNNSHTVHFGGTFSVNDIIRQDPEAYHKAVEALAATTPLPDSIDAKEYASLLWVYQMIHKAGGLAIMAHPCWIQDYSYHVRLDMYRYMLEAKPFDALELTGGQTLEENQRQISVWQQMREEGHPVPIVGSSDSHGTVNAEWFNISKMIVLAEACEKDALIEAVKKRQTVVAEQYHGEALPRVYGTDRAVGFVLFLLTEYLPLHDALCIEEGRLMKDYANGCPEAGKTLIHMKGRTTALVDKYWQTLDGSAI